MSVLGKHDAQGVSEFTQERPDLERETLVCLDARQLGGGAFKLLAVAVTAVTVTVTVMSTSTSRWRTPEFLSGAITRLSPGRDASRA